MLSRILGAIGRILITAGTLILLFVAYQLWGTGLQEAKAQKSLDQEFSQAKTEVTTTTSSTTTTTAPGSGLRVVPDDTSTVDYPLPTEGDAIAKIRIPSIGVDRTVVEGVPLSQLKRGPGHYPETPLPGQAGNVAIAGHRTTYGQPFHNIDKVQKGDEVIFETLHQGTFVYRVTDTIIVKPNQVEVLDDKGDNRVTLIACHPKYSARERIVVIGKLEGKAAPAYTGQTEAREKLTKAGELAGDTIDGGLSGVGAPKGPVFFWALVAAGIWFVAWLCQVFLRRRNRARAEETGEPTSRGWRLVTWVPYAVFLPLFLTALYVFFENFDRLLPGNY